MSSIFKLQISGVRSFDARDKQTIQFGSPLTLIVGQNGTGKTTIIECLKYATTGDLPPNSKGGAFVHDPHMGGGRETLAQVKLAFTATNGKQAICTRSMSLTIKKTARTFKTLDSNIMVKDQGKMVQLNSRCADIGEQMSIMLGVSKAVLEYVIFCHQEDSLWPLAEPSVVKKRFDDIFEATKFTKALENIKTIRKDYGNNIKLQEKDVDHLRSDKDRADKAQRRADVLVADMENYKDQIAVLKREMNQVLEDQTKLFESAQKFQEVLAKLDQLRQNKTLAERSIQTTLQDLSGEEMAEPTNEIQDLLDSSSARTEERKRRRIELKSEASELKEESGTLQNEINLESTRRGQLEAKKSAHEMQVKQMAKLCEDIVNTLELGTEVSNSEEVKELLESALADVGRELSRLQAEVESSEAELSQVLSELRSEKSRYDLQKSRARDEQRDNDKEMKTLQQDIDMLQVDEGKKEYEESKLTELQADLKAQQEKLAVSNLDELISAEKKNKYELEEKIDKLNRDFKQANTQSQSLSRLEFKRTDLKHKDTALEKLLSVEKGRFEKIIGKKMDKKRIETDLNGKIRELRDNIAKQSKKVEDAARDQTSVRTRLEYCEEEISSKTSEAADLKSQISDILVEPTLQCFDETLASTKVEHENASLKLQQNEFFRAFYRNAESKCKSLHACVLCEREFDDTEEKSFLTLLANKADQVKDMVELKNVMDHAQADLDSLQEIGPSVTRCTALNDEEIPKSKEEAKRLRREKEDIERQLEEEQDALSGLNEKLSEAEALRKFASDVTRTNQEVAELTLAINDLLEEIGDTSSHQSPDAIHAELSKANNEAKQIDAKISGMIDERDILKSGIQATQTKIAAKRLDVSKIETALSQRQSKMDKMKGLADRHATLKSSLSEANHKLQEVGPKIENYEAELRRLKIDNQKKLDSTRDRVNRMSQMGSKLNELDEAITSYSGAVELEKSERKLEELKDKVASNAEKQNTIGEQIRLEEAALQDVVGYERKLRDNLKLRDWRSQISQITDTIDSMEWQNAEQEKLSYEGETRKLDEKRAMLAAEEAGKRGEMRQMDDQLTAINSELQSEFLNVHQQYREAVLKLATTSHANEDLARYSKALDSAIMKYHSMKMERINKTIDELWKRTYTGTDIDSICIKSDNESAKGNRTYNYRVVMVKQDVELDMRGRCSAGQKVLASIIIRLALAETFGHNCGLIALDEPTTNLDSQNIEALAKSLNAILAAREKQRNFQLIAITHDIEFLRHLSASTYVDHYYKVERDAKQSSTITQTDIHTIDE